MFDIDKCPYCGNDEVWLKDSRNIRFSCHTEYSRISGLVTKQGELCKAIFENQKAYTALHDAARKVLKAWHKYNKGGIACDFNNELQNLEDETRKGV